MLFLSKKKSKFTIENQILKEFPIKTCFSWALLHFLRLIDRGVCKNCCVGKYMFYATLYKLNVCTHSFNSNNCNFNSWERNSSAFLFYHSISLSLISLFLNLYLILYLFLIPLLFFLFYFSFSNSSSLFLYILLFLSFILLNLYLCFYSLSIPLFTTMNWKFLPIEVKYIEGG